uniref:Innate immunity activator a n=1 Tax=Sander lucioperca TaxID=283035 RepID=A0A8D0AMP1_SANLU
MTAIESKEEISDTDSGIIVHSGPDSPTSPVKELTTHTRALKLKHQSLEEPLNERRIGASFKLDEGLIHLDKQVRESIQLQVLETDLALQRQIYEAARKLSLEENLSKPQKKSRLQQCKRVEKKVKDLQEAVFQHRIKSECNSPCISISNNQNRGELHCCPLQAKLCTALINTFFGFDDTFIITENQKSKTSRTQVSAESIIPLSQFIKNAALRQNHSTSAPSTPELHVRRQYSQSFRYTENSENNQGRARLPQRRCMADFMVHSPEYSPLRPYQSSSEDSSSEHSSSSYVSSPGRDGPTEIPKLCPPPYGFHLGAQKKGLSNFTSSHKNINQSQPSPGYVRPMAEDCPLSPQDLDMGKCFLSSPPAAHSPRQRQWQEGALSPRGILKPPPPYTRLVRTPSLKEYPNHAIRLMPRDIVSEELKSWHQRNQMQKFRPGCVDQQSFLSVKSPTSPHLPPFKQVDGTPVQWFVAEDAEIVSQV